MDRLYDRISGVVLEHARHGSRFLAQPQYSHGYLVPLFTVVLLMLRREPFGPVSNRERWIGLGALAVFMAIRVYACLVRMAAIDMYTFVPVMLAVLMLLGGWQLLRWAGPAVFFLIFMFPLSAKMERVFLDPLQRIAMAGGTYALQTTGIETYAVANHIYIRDKDDVQQDVSVAEACSGLNMLTIFSAMSVALVLLMPAPVGKNRYRSQRDSDRHLCKCLPNCRVRSAALLQRECGNCVSRLPGCLLHDAASHGHAVPRIHHFEKPGD